MELGDDHIKDLFSSKLSRFEADLPSGLWDSIETKLPSVATTVVAPKLTLKQKTIRFSALVSGVAAMIIAVLLLLPSENDESSSFVAYSPQAFKYDLRNDRSTQTSSNHAHLTQITLPTNNILPQSKSKSKTNSHQRSVAKNEFVENLTDKSIKSILPKIYFLQEQDIASLSIPEKENTPTDLDAQFYEDLSKKIAAFEAQGQAQNELLAYVENVQTGDYEDKLQLGIAGGGSVSSANQSKSNITPAYSQGSNVSLRSIEGRIKHNQPVTFGITISKQLSRNLSIESGITYSYLSSELGVNQYSNYKQKDMQYLHYFGIPLTLNYTFLQLNKFSFYSSLGGMIQKDLFGRRTSYGYVSSSDSDYGIRENISQRNLQFSLNGGLGVSYPLYDKMRLYTNIGAAYYVDAKNEYATIYSDKKWLLNLNIGVKFEF